MASLLFPYASSAIFTAKSNLQLEKCSLTSLKLLFFAPTLSYLFFDLCLDENQKLQGGIYLCYLKCSIPLLSALKAMLAFTRDLFFLSDLTKLINSLLSQDLLHLGLIFLVKKVLIDILHQNYTS